MFKVFYLSILPSYRNLFYDCRCLLPTVDQETGIRDANQEPWKTLQT